WKLCMTSPDRTDTSNAHVLTWWRFRPRSSDRGGEMLLAGGSLGPSPGTDWSFSAAQARRQQQAVGAQVGRRAGNAIAPQRSAGERGIPLLPLVVKTYAAECGRAPEIFASVVTSTCATKPRLLWYWATTSSIACAGSG